MAIAAYVGLPGHGKSYSVVEHVVLPALKAGRTIVTNLPLKVAELELAFPSLDVRFFTIDGVRAAPDSLLEVAAPGCVFIIDEAQQLWPSGMLPNRTPAAWLSFITEHRHRVDDLRRSTEIVVVTQDLGNVASFVRKLVEQTYRTVKLISLGSNTRFRVDVYTGPAAGPNPPVKNRVRQMAGKYRPEIYRYYVSHTQAEGEGSGAVEGSVDKRVVVWRSPLLWGGALIAVVLGVGGVVAVVSYFSGPDAPSTGRSESSVTAAPSNVVGGRVGAAAAQWRIVGVVSHGANTVLYLSTGSQYVAIDARAWCEQDLAGFWVCEWQGARVSNDLQQLPRAAQGVPASGPGF